MMYPSATTSTIRVPVGVVGLITSFNYPLLLAVWKTAPALACGNSVIIKPPDQAPLSALLLASIFQELGCPPGILSVLPGSGKIGQAIANHPGIDKVSFTGSDNVGRLVMQSAARTNLKQVTLELGGKSPIIVFNDANIGKAVDDVYGAIFTNMGENCCAGSRLFLQEDIHDEFLQRLKQKVAETARLGDPLDDAHNFGPLGTDTFAR